MEFLVDWVAANATRIGLVAVFVVVVWGIPLALHLWAGDGRKTL